MPQLRAPQEARRAALFQGAGNCQKVFGPLHWVLLQALLADLLQYLWQGTLADLLDSLCIAVHVASHCLPFATMALPDLWGSESWRKAIGLNLHVVLHWRFLCPHAVEALCGPKVSQHGPSVEALDHRLSLEIAAFTPQDIAGLEISMNEARQNLEGQGYSQAPK